MLGHAASPALGRGLLDDPSDDPKPSQTQNFKKTGYAL